MPVSASSLYLCLCCCSADGLISTIFLDSTESEREYSSVKSNSLRPHGIYSPWNSPGQNTGVGSLSLLQGIFPTQRSNPGLSHCRRIVYQLSHKESCRILEWVAYPFSRKIFWPWNWTGVSCLAGEFFTNWATREALDSICICKYKVFVFHFLTYFTLYNRLLVHPPH